MVIKSHDKIGHTTFLGTLEKLLVFKRNKIFTGLYTAALQSPSSESCSFFIVTHDVSGDHSYSSDCSSFHSPFMKDGSARSESAVTRNLAFTGVASTTARCPLPSALSSLSATICLLYNYCLPFCPLSAVCCLLSTVCCLMPSVSCILPLSAILCPLPAVLCPLSAVPCLLSFAHCPLSAFGWPGW